MILGGGDGGVLRQLLELPNPPKDVIMIDLDEAVMRGYTLLMPYPSSIFQ